MLSSDSDSDSGNDHEHAKKSARPPWELKIPTIS